MATKYYGVTPGGDMETEVTKAGSTTSAAIELVVNDAATNISKLAVLKALDAMKQVIIKDTWPPA